MGQTAAMSMAPGQTQAISTEHRTLLEQGHPELPQQCQGLDSPPWGSWRSRAARERGPQMTSLVQAIGHEHNTPSLEVGAESLNFRSGCL